MPRNVRNFYAYVNVDGRASKIETGPRASSGGMSIRLLNRKDGSIDPTEVVIECRVRSSDGKLVIGVSEGGKQVLFREVDR